METHSESPFIAITEKPVVVSSLKSQLLLDEEVELKQDCISPGQKYDRQLIFIKWGLQTVAIMNAMLILVPAVDLLDRTRQQSSFINERHEDVRVYVRATAALAIIVCATQVSVTIYTLFQDGAFKIWCISHLIFAAIFASIASCAISSNLHRTTTGGFQLLYFVSVNGVFSLTAASILLFTALPKNSVLITV